MAERVTALAAEHFPAVELHFHPQCFLSSGHFAGSDAERAAALVEIANDATFDALWFGRGGYGSGRIAEDALGNLNEAARAKIYLGYSDAGAMLAGLCPILRPARPRRSSRRSPAPARSRPSTS